MEKKNRIIVSLTSYPERIQSVDKVIRTLLIQTLRPDEIILWLSKEEFPEENEDLPKELTELCKYGLSIRWVTDDLKPHKKYYYVMQEYYNHIIITVDDDIYYSPELVESLYNSYMAHPNAISCARANLICKDNEGKLLPYKCWEKKFTYCSGMEAMDLLAVGCGGILYPPKCFDLDVLCDTDRIKKYCLYQDDLWLKANEIIGNIPIVLIHEYIRLPVVLIKGTQEAALCENVNISGNDEALRNLNDYYISQGNKALSELIFSNGCTIAGWLQRQTERVYEIVEKYSDTGMYIYGAGKGAISTYGCLKEINKEEMIKGFVVSCIDTNPAELYHIPVIEIDELKNPECLILVSTGDELQEEIVQTLKQRGFGNVLTVNNSIVGDYNNSQEKMEEVRKSFWALCKVQ